MFTLLAFTGAAMLGYGFSSVMTALLADVAVTGIALSTYSTYQQGVAQGKANEASAKIAANQAAAQEAQAQEYERQAALQKEQEGLDQIQGEQEAAKRARARAAEVGSTYAAAAGNGLLVSGSETDTFANVLKSQEQEAQADIQTIRANTALGVWSREEQARSYLVAAQQSRYGVTGSLLSSSSYASQARYARSNGITSAAGSALSGVATTAIGANGLAKETGGYQWGGTKVAASAK